MNFLEIESLLKNIIDEANSLPSSEIIFTKKIPQNINLIELLESSISEKIYYFKSKYNPIEILALGKSITLNKEEEITNFIEKNTEAYVCAPLKFELDEQFLNRVYVADWTFIHEIDQTTIILVREKNKSFPNIYLFLDFNIKAHLHYESIDWNESDEDPHQDQWSLMLDAAKKLFENNQLNKIVLSRSKIFKLTYPIEPRLVFLQLLRKNEHSSKVYNIYYQEKINAAFMSISPEILFAQNGDDFFSISLAGSTPRGESEIQDKNLENKLQVDKKLISEHDIVTDEIVRSIDPFVFSREISQLKTMKLPYIQHSAKEISAKLNNRAHVLDLLRALHPTPAVGGHPKSKALKYIFELEKKSRNFYAAPFGYFNKKKSEFSVAIRSGEITDQTLTVFGGAGILPSSDADEEWIETGIKMTPFLKVFNHE